jgi:hypothetical protein
MRNDGRNYYHTKLLKLVIEHVGLIVIKIDLIPSVTRNHLRDTKVRTSIILYIINKLVYVPDSDSWW